MLDKKSLNSKQLCVDAYEAILYKNRVNEKSLVNKVRFSEYEKNRPPEDKWYTLKTAEFSKELYRNRVALKPNNENSVYLKKLRDPYIY